MAFPPASGLNATQPPSAKAGFSWTSPSITCMSLLGNENFITPPGFIAPLRPSVCSTADQFSVVLDCRTAVFCWARAGWTQSAKRTAPAADMAIRREFDRELQWLYCINTPPLQNLVDS